MKFHHLVFTVSQMGGIVALQMLRRLGRHGAHRSEDAPKAMLDWTDPTCNLISTMHLVNKDYKD